MLCRQAETIFRYMLVMSALALGIWNFRGASRLKKEHQTIQSEESSGGIVSDQNGYVAFSVNRTADYAQVNLHAEEVAEGTEDNSFPDQRSAANKSTAGDDQLATSSQKHEDGQQQQEGINETLHVRWALLIHLSGQEERYNAIRQTWFQKTSPRLGLLAFGVKPKNFADDIPFLLTLRPNSTDWRKDAFPDTRNAFTFAKTLFPNAEYFTKSDDDAYLYTHNLAMRIFASPSASYSGCALYARKFTTYGAGGAGYSLSRSAVIHLANCTDWLSDHEDLAMGMCLKRFGIGLTNWPGYHVSHPWQVVQYLTLIKQPNFIINFDTVEGYMTPLSYHNIAPNDMTLLMHDDMNNLGSPRRRSRKLPRIVHRFNTNDSSCADVNPGWKHNVWSLNNINLRAWKGNMKRSQAFHSYNSTYAASFEILMTYGGIFVDDRVQCIGSLDKLIDEFFENDIFNPSDGFILPEGVLALHPLSPSAVGLVHQWFKSNVSISEFAFEHMKGESKVKNTKANECLEQTKVKDKYILYEKEYKTDKSDIVPLVFDTYGGYAKRTISFLSEVADSVAGDDEKLKAKLARGLRDKIAVALHTGQAELMFWLNRNNPYEEAPKSGTKLNKVWKRRVDMIVGRVRV